jgi:sensor domain CHASE-containing protein
VLLLLPFLNFPQLPRNTANGTNIQLLPQGVITDVYPHAASGSAVGLNLFKDPARRPGALEALERGEMTMQGPVKAAQGWTALFFRLPVWIDNVTSPADVFG